MNANERIADLLDKFDPDKLRHPFMLFDAPVGSETGARTMTPDEQAECEHLTRTMYRDVAKVLKDMPIRRTNGKVA